MSVFNGARHLERSVKSILDQAGVSLELLVINDGSTDDSGAILERLAAGDARMIVISQQNMGLTRALIRGCRMARGCYIARQDCDDYSLPERLALQQKLLDDNPEIALVSSWAEVIGPCDEFLMVHMRPAESDVATELLMRKRIGPPGHGSLMFRKKVYEQVGGYRELFYYAQDSDLWVRMAMVGKLAYVPQVLYRYRVDSDSISGRNDALKAHYKALVNRLHVARRNGVDEDTIIAQYPLPSNDQAPTFPSSKAGTLYFIARCLVAQRDGRALGYLFRTLGINPMNLKAWCLIPIAVMHRLGTISTKRSASL